jgi:hypothetical protein
MSLHFVTVEHLPADDRWDIWCTCGFEVAGLDTEEAADDTADWHLGEPSYIGQVTGIPYSVEAES